MSAQDDSTPASQTGPHLLRVLRLKAGLSQESLADRSGISERTIRSLEAGRVGRPHGRTLAAVGQALDLDGADADRLTMAWGATERLRLPQLFSEGAPPHRLAEAFQRQYDCIDERTIHDITTVGADRHIEGTQIRRSFDVTAPGVDRLFWLTSAPRELVDATLVRVTSTVNFHLGAVTILPAVDALMFEALFGRVMGVGETNGADYLVDYRDARLPGASPETLAARAVVMPLRSLFMQVRFAPQAVPTEAWQMTQESVDGSTEHVRRLTINELGVAQFWLEPAPKGIHGITWRW